MLNINVNSHSVKKREDFRIPGTGKEQPDKPLAGVNRSELGQAVIAFQDKSQIAYFVLADSQVKINALHFLTGNRAWRSRYTFRVALTLPMSS